MIVFCFGVFLPPPRRRSRTLAARRIPIKKSLYGPGGASGLINRNWLLPISKPGSRCPERWRADAKSSLRMAGLFFDFHSSDFFPPSAVPVLRCLLPIEALSRTEAERSSVVLRRTGLISAVEFRVLGLPALGWTAVGAVLDLGRNDNGSPSSTAEDQPAPPGHHGGRTGASAVALP